MVTILNVVQIVVSVLLVVAILLQVRGAGLGDIFGGGGGGTFRTRRGLERRLFQFTIVLVVVFLAVSLISVRVS